MHIASQIIPAEETPVVVIGNGPIALYAVLQLARHGLHPVLVERDGPAGDTPASASLRAQIGAELPDRRPLFLGNRTATSVWGSLDGGFNVETDTGETITGSAVILTHDANNSAEITGLQAIADYYSSETTEPGIFILSEAGATAEGAIVEALFVEALRSVKTAATRVAKTAVSPQATNIIAQTSI